MKDPQTEKVVLENLRILDAEYTAPKSDEVLHANERVIDAQKRLRELCSVNRSGVEVALQNIRKNHPELRAAQNFDAADFLPQTKNPKDSPQTANNNGEDRKEQMPSEAHEEEKKQEFVDQCYAAIQECWIAQDIVRGKIYEKIARLRKTGGMFGRSKRRKTEAALNDMLGKLAPIMDETQRVVYRTIDDIRSGKMEIPGENFLARYHKQNLSEIKNIDAAMEQTAA